MNQNDLNEINNEYNEADKARSTARQAALEAWHEYDKRRADKDHAEVRFRQLSFCLMDAHRDGIPDDKRAKLEELRVEAEHAATAAEEARTVYMNKASDLQRAEAALNESIVRLRNLILSPS